MSKPTWLWYVQANLLLSLEIRHHSQCCLLFLLKTPTQRNRSLVIPASLAMLILVPCNQRNLS
eukprot:NODE_424_length_1708_cov_90.237492_g308_i0.p2 GENE.NODE_424_length_1708_cov_90.237492_g308_i0~~NODE_424_length_1708_cov_90.237492_g308_i0.p2  ORF type:complete len:63 (-),score=12.96 NODE_424_length_1708_cov_90.237492_g308_i0:235-423(-)